ncbi:MAG: metallophosphoesterase, partial [Pseudomonadota bacterium]
HQVFAAGQNLPHFLREAPPVFTVKDATKRDVRVLAFGDFGDGSGRQERIAAAMRRFHNSAAFDLAITAGDNFYPAGARDPDDARFTTDFARHYEPMHIPFFPSLGNHDWILADSPAAEILHSAKSTSWRMPAARYTFVAGPVQFFAIDTNLVSRAQFDWLERELARSTARWKIVYGHHPIYSHGFHGDQPQLREKLLPLLRGHADIYLCGHEHDLQHLAPDGGVHFVVAGGGGAAPRPITPGPRSLFAASKNGFAAIEATRQKLKVSIVGEDLQLLHQFTLGD